MGFCRICKVEYGADKSLKFHRLPRDENIKNEWIKIIGKVVPDTSLVCSRHFLENDYAFSRNGKKKILKSGAVPTLTITDNASSTEFNDENNGSSVQTSSVVKSNICSNEVLNINRNLIPIGAGLHIHDSNIREDNSWEPEENLDCPDLIAAFEAQFETLSSDNEKTKRKNISEDNRARGFDRGLEPDRIVGATDASGELMFLMMWKNCREADLVPAHQVNVRCPEIVISYYENKQPWYGGGGGVGTNIETAKQSIIELD